MVQPTEGRERGRGASGGLPHDDGLDGGIKRGKLIERIELGGVASYPDHAQSGNVNLYLRGTSLRIPKAREET